MKHIVMTACLCVICNISLTFAQHQDQTNASQVGEPQYSALATELIAFYQPHRGIRLEPRALTPPWLQPEHLDEKHRAAWEELLLVAVDESRDRDMRVTTIRYRITEALGRIADPRSIPVLREAFRRTTRSGVNQGRVVRLQEQILNTLTVVENTEALEAILSSLDLVEQVHAIQGVQTTGNGSTLREYIFRSMLQPDISGKSDYYQGLIRRGERWQSLIESYQNPDLSPANQNFLERAKGIKRPDEHNE